MTSKKTTATTKKSTNKKAAARTTKSKQQVDNFQPTKLSLAVSALAASTLVLLAVVITS